jgi:hypothetical protein
VNYLTGSAGTFLKELRDMSNYKFLNVLWFPNSQLSITCLKRYFNVIDTYLSY